MKSRVLGIVMVAALVACGQEPPEPRVAASESAAAGANEASSADRLPVANLSTLQALVAETAAADRVLVLDFWATWCMPCIEMFPTLHGGLKDMGDAVRPVTVTLDSPGKYEQQAAMFLREHNAIDDAYLLSIDDGDREAVVDGLGDQWNALVVPAILVFDREGQLAGEFFGGDAEPVLQRVRELASPLPAEQPPSTQHPLENAPQDRPEPASNASEQARSAPPAPRHPIGPPATRNHPPQDPST